MSRGARILGGDAETMDKVTWNLWHGCHKLSAGCKNCYVYRTDEKHGRDSSIVQKTSNFDLPVRRDRKGAYKVEPGTLVYTCFTSDFFLEDADLWRPDAFAMMRQRPDLAFLLVTKRVDRIEKCLPPDWGEGYENLRICCTVENQDRADYRLPIFKALPIAHKSIVCEPLLEGIDMRAHLGDWVEEVIAGGESGHFARLCNYDWVLDIREQCMERGIPFTFKQTGANFQKDGKVYRILRKDQHPQARKAGINTLPERTISLVTKEDGE